MINPDDSVRKYPTSARAIIENHHHTASFFEEEVKIRIVGFSLFCIKMPEKVKSHKDDIGEWDPKVERVILTEHSINKNSLTGLHYFYEHTPADKHKK